MNTTLIRSGLPHAVALVIFILITFIYLNPLFEGKRLRQDDIMRHKGMSREIVEFRDRTGGEPLWTNSMFSGMPAYQISVKYKGNLIRFLDDVIRLGLPHPAGLVFLYMLGFYFLMLTLRMNPWLSMVGAVAFGFSSYFFIILEAGHNSKAHSIGYMAPVLAGIIMTYRGRYLAGALITGLALALQVYAGHPQITYYLLLLVIILALFEFFIHLRQKTLAEFAKATGLLVLASVLAVMTHITSLWATWEYGKYTIRGKTELTSEEENRTSGLDKDYATQWSYGVGETFTLMVPNVRGGSSNGSMSESSHTFREMVKNQIPENQARQYIQRMPTYWGPQPFTSGPVYVGAIMVFLFITGLILVKGKLKWWLLTGTILSITLAWGRNFMPLTDLFLDYVPGYNKFRAVSMTLVIAEVSIPLLAMLALARIFDEQMVRPLKIHAIKWGLGVAGGLAFLFALLPGAFFDFSSPQDAGVLPDWLIPALEEDRKNMLQSDAFRSLLLILASLAVILAFLYGKIRKVPAIALIGILILVDLWPVNKRYLNNENFVNPSVMEKPFPKTQADEIILKDKDPYFRVMNLTVDPFADASTSWFHNSIGGYHGAKLRRYQELYDHQIRENNMDVLNMLNTKYIIRQGNDNKPEVLPNTRALGNAWFVSDILWVNNADEELNALSDFDPAVTAVIDRRFQAVLNGFTPSFDSTAMIGLIQYEPNHLIFQSNTSRDQLAVFSDIYYDKGWNAYVDEQLTPHFRLNYVLRGMIIPSGKHKVEFRFEPRVFRVGEKISLASSLLLLLLAAGFGIMQIYRSYKGK
ncbi:MAG: YfhO family protein [Bacteroidales bacterium]|nr:YfhO family protein [Bacteroidales bacterium]